MRNIMVIATGTPLLQKPLKSGVSAQSQKGKKNPPMSASGTESTGCFLR